MDSDLLIFFSFSFCIIFFSYFISHFKVKFHITAIISSFFKHQLCLKAGFFTFIYAATRWPKMVFLMVAVSGEIIRAEDLKRVLADFTPLSLWGASLHPSGSRTWSDVGGLRRVKEDLVQSLLWPGKVKHIKVTLFQSNCGDLIANTLWWVMTYHIHVDNLTYFIRVGKKDFLIQIYRAVFDYIRYSNFKINKNAHKNCNLIFFTSV